MSGWMGNEAQGEETMFCAVCGKEGTIPRRRVVDRRFRYKCPVCTRAYHLSILTTTVADFDQRGSGSERILTALFYSERGSWGIPAGYFCVQQSASAFRYMLIPQGIANPRAADYAGHAGYTDWIPGYFSKALEDDARGKKRIAIPELPEKLRDMSLNINIRQPASSVCGGVLEVFCLNKRKYDGFQVVWTLEFPGSFGNQGAGGNDPVPPEFFQNRDLHGFAQYMAEKYRSLECTADEILRNREIRKLFEPCAETMNRS